MERARGVQASDLFHVSSGQGAGRWVRASQSRVSSWAEVALCAVALLSRLLSADTACGTLARLTVSDRELPSGLTRSGTYRARRDRRLRERVNVSLIILGRYSMNRFSTTTQAKASATAALGDLPPSAGGYCDRHSASHSARSYTLRVPVFEVHDGSPQFRGYGRTF
jgi:hypothetical protein